MQPIRLFRHVCWAEAYSPHTNCWTRNPGLSLCFSWLWPLYSNVCIVLTVKLIYNTQHRSLCWEAIFEFWRKREFQQNFLHPQPFGKLVLDCGNRSLDPSSFFGDCFISRHQHPVLRLPDRFPHKIWINKQLRN